MHEEPADQNAGDKFAQDHDGPLATADAVQRGDEQAEGDCVQHCAEGIERMAGERRSRQKAVRQP